MARVEEVECWFREQEDHAEHHGQVEEASELGLIEGTLGMLFVQE